MIQGKKKSIRNRKYKTKKNRGKGEDESATSKSLRQAQRHTHYYQLKSALNYIFLDMCPTEIKRTSSQIRIIM